MDMLRNIANMAKNSPDVSPQQPQLGQAVGSSTITKNAQRQNHIEETDKINKKVQTKVNAQQLVCELNELLDPFKTDLKFGFDDNNDAYRVYVKEQKTGRILRKFPTDEALELSMKMKELVQAMFDKQSGILLDEKG